MFALVALGLSGLQNVQEITIKTPGDGKKPEAYMQIFFNSCIYFVEVEDS